ncbi:MAG: DUF2188 domain-containing protein [Burkholderiales bacterium]
MAWALQHRHQELMKESAMEPSPDRNRYFTVTRSRSGQWEVNEPGFDRPIVSFSDRNDALDYARRLAEFRRSVGGRPYSLSRL